MNNVFQFPLKSDREGSNTISANSQKGQVINLASAFDQSITVPPEVVASTLNLLHAVMEFDAVFNNSEFGEQLLRVYLFEQCIKWNLTLRQIIILVEHAFEIFGHKAFLSTAIDSEIKILVALIEFEHISKSEDKPDLEVAIARAMRKSGLKDPNPILEFMRMRLDKVVLEGDALDPDDPTTGSR